MTGGASARPDDAWAQAKFAAALFAIDPLQSGVSLRAAPGPARDAWLALLRAYLPPDAPMRRAPLAIADDRLLGGLDLAATLRAGRPIAESGLLAQTHGGVLVLAMAERHSSATAARIVAALDAGRIDLARDGLAAQQDARIGVVALDEGQAEDERPPAALLDRLAIHLDLAETRPCACGQQEVTPQEILAARARLADVVTPHDGIAALVAIAARLGVDSLRAPLLALRVARAACALRGARVVEDVDLEMAARYVLAPRATCLPAPPEETAPDEAPDCSEREPDPAQDDNPGRDQQALEDVIIAAACAALPPDLLARLTAGQKSRAPAPRSGHSGAARVSPRRGRPLNTRRGALRDGRLSLIDTLRAAAPWQRLRRIESDAAPTLAVHVRSDDFRITRFREKRGTTAIFVVDASGSSALQRLAEVKGAIELMLADCYVRRDSVALIAFRGRQAEIVLPPTRSLARAKRLLAAMPGGGGTPLAHGLDLAATLADGVSRKGQTPLVALLTDGKANIDRAGAPGRARALEDALLAARRLRCAGHATLAIDSSPVTSGADAPTRKIADAMQARYLRLPFVDAARLSEAVRAVAIGP
ncbi:magnesium chelatase subunit D [Methylocystis echinoides]|uniref:Mg-protoporphyrin IX chelatase n=1 Tax=Methylocystis echinoides TaxID=29468 RepID=A0A9W6GXF5_9HYPH|nr:magnesium chelatase subunit D [Methylocystis echinoides]GLI94858.1 Mg-protoporphyrin IX chelatase [Methylocystis echinoides]